MTEDTSSMSFREKSAWISFGSILLVALVYFLHIPPTLTPPPRGDAFHALLICIVALIVIEVVAHAAVAMRAPRDAQAPKDEREQLIELKATRVAARVYVLGSLGAVSLIHAGATGPGVANATILALVVAQLVNYGTRIAYYRRDS